MSLAVVFAVIYGVVLALLFGYGVNGYALLLARRVWREPRAPEPTRWPHVVVQLPVYNERDVVRRLVRAAAGLRYPGKLELQVLDDSTDDTTALIAAEIRRLAAAGVDIRHLRRERRLGFKAGALADGLACTDAELVLILDADFVPPPGLLLQLVPHALIDDVACVQGRWGHLNRDASGLTRAQALGIDVHFAVEQRARAAAGWPVAFNGSGGLWRRDALVDAGGWSADTLTEDLDLSYRAWLRGWRLRYVDVAECPAEIPEHIAAFKAQQRRWARGSTETARKLLGRVWRSRARLGAKLQATLHLTHYFVHPLMLLSAALALPLGWLAPASHRWWSVLPPLALATGGSIAMALAATAGRGLSARERVRDVGRLMLLGVGLAVSNTIAVARGLRSRGGVFERTPKGGARSSYALAADPLAVAELACAAACAALAVWLAARGILAMTPFLLLYAAGLARVGGASLRHSLRERARAALFAREA